MAKLYEIFSVLTVVDQIQRTLSLRFWNENGIELFLAPDECCVARSHGSYRARDSPLSSPIPVGNDKYDNENQNAQDAQANYQRPAAPDGLLGLQCIFGTAV